MKQSRRVSPLESVTFKESCPNRSGALEDLSGTSVELAATLLTPRGRKFTFDALGTSTGDVIANGTIPDETGTHRLFYWVNGEMRSEINLIARGQSSETGATQISITADRTTVTADMV